MREHEWLTSTDPAAMLTSLNHGHGPEISNRKLRLFVCACLAMSDSTKLALSCGIYDYGEEGGKIADDILVTVASDWCITQRDYDPPKQLKADLFREIFGNPFRPAALDASLRTPDVRMLAGRAYEERVERVCEKCKGSKSFYRFDREAHRKNERGGKHVMIPPRRRENCPDCHGIGRIQDGSLGTGTFAALADALEEAGCVEISEEAVSGMYICEKCSNIQDISKEAGIYCRKCNSEFCRKQRRRDLPHPIISHLRSPTPHYRGCWVLDLLLGKE